MSDIIKAPNAVLDYGHNWTDWLDDGTISTTEILATNLVGYSDVGPSGTGWIPGSGVTVAQATSDPAGGDNALNVLSDGANENRSLRYASTEYLTGGASYVLSAYIRKDTSQLARLGCYINAQANWQALLTFALDAGGVPSHVGSTGNITDYGFVSVGGNWWRVWTSFSASIDSDPWWIYFYPDYAGDAEAMDIYGVQLEAGSVVTDYSRNGAAVATGTKWEITGPDTSLQVYDSTRSGAQTIARLKGGTVHAEYTATNRIVTTAGLKDDRSILVKIQDK